MKLNEIKTIEVIEPNLNIKQVLSPIFLQISRTKLHNQGRDSTLFLFLVSFFFFNLIISYWVFFILDLAIVFLKYKDPTLLRKNSDTCFQFCKIKCNYIDLKQLKLEGSNFLYIKIHGLKKRSNATLLTRATYMLACGKRLSCSSSVCSLFRCLYTVFYDCVRTARWDLSGDRAHVHGRVIVSLW